MGSSADQYFDHYYYKTIIQAVEVMVEVSTKFVLHPLKRQ